jgi:hypothetical protein
MSKTFRSMGKATHYHGDNRLSYSLKVNTNSNIGASVRSNREHMFITTPAAEQAVAPSNDTPALQRQQDDSSGSAATTSAQPLTQQPTPSASNSWRATLAWLLARLVSLLFTLVRALLHKWACAFCCVLMPFPSGISRTPLIIPGHDRCQTLQVRIPICQMCVHCAHPCSSTVCMYVLPNSLVLAPASTSCSCPSTTTLLARVEAYLYAPKHSV